MLITDFYVPFFASDHTNYENEFDKRQKLISHFFFEKVKKKAEHCIQKELIYFFKLAQPSVSYLIKHVELRVFKCLLKRSILLYPPYQFVYEIISNIDVV